MVSISAPYLIPLFLGMTFDARYNKPGVDIYDSKFVNDPVITDFKQTRSTYKVVNSMSDVKSALDVSGDLSLKIKSGMIDVEGKGSYLKNVRDYVNKVEILTTLEYTSSVHSFKADAKPRDKWVDLYNVGVLGTHYVSSITYGAEMVASLRFEVFNSSDVQEVKGAVNAALGSGGDGLQIAAEGKLETLQKKVEGKANLAISYYGTVPLKSIPNDIEGFRKLVTTFKEQVEEANLTDGIPMKVDLTSLEDIAEEEDRDKFKFLKNKNLVDQLADFENMLDEMRQARLDLTGWAKALPYHIEEKYEKERNIIQNLELTPPAQVGRLIRNITQVTEVFYDVIWKMDLTEGPEQLQPPFRRLHYERSSGPSPGFHNRGRDCNREGLNPLIKRDEVAADTYVQWGNNNCTAANTQLLYQGFAISSTEEGIGGMAEYECAPSSPQKSYDLIENVLKSHLAGIRYTMLEQNVNPFKGKNAKKISRKGVTCAKCYSPDSASVVMFSATESCPLTWEKMYTGYLMSSRVGGHTTQYVCVDDTPASGYEMEDEEFSKDTMALTVVHSSGSLPSETYVNNALIRCAVCAMKSNQISF
ncbi:Stonustoxin subunit alpha like protein [Argiope bruennichi]|uniref:Stonustoxin subunit alpha like protein n=1 Tax=Argiope bruennichi TaxID=94029 RepID=A0A8T0E9J8_ARGBR|nr:Stonustoxin subunit alpha like protein [Argiope bruennichi]